MFCGHLGKAELDAVALANSVSTKRDATPCLLLPKFSKYLWVKLSFDVKKIDIIENFREYLNTNYIQIINNLF